MSACIEWEGSRDRGGYGRLGRKLAHREMWTRLRGAIPPGMVVMHACDNPPCVNIEHLRLGTQADNVRDMWAKRRGDWRTGQAATAQVMRNRTHCPKGHEYDEANTYVNRGRRFCRACKRENRKAART